MRHNTHSLDRTLAFLLGWPLDQQLAAGRPPESSALLAARAQRITGFRRCEDLARNWEHVVTRARRPSASHPLALPLCRGRVIAAEPAIRDLAARLRSLAPVGAGGVAAAQLLLTDGTGPLYNAAVPDESLVIRLRGALARLELSPARSARSRVLSGAASLTSAPNLRGWRRSRGPRPGPGYIRRQSRGSSGRWAPSGPRPSPRWTSTCRGSAS